MNNLIYVLCPPSTITGGPDALHQMVYYLNIIGTNAKITYIRTFKNEKIGIPDPYKIYVASFCYLDEVLDSEDISLIIPETASYYGKRFKKAKKYLWWLSVDNNIKRSKLLFKIMYLLTLPLRVYKHKKFYSTNFVTKVKYNLNQNSYSFSNEDKNITHLCASYYAYDYVSKKTSNTVYKAIEPISKAFLDFYKNDKCGTNKENLVIYNPVKCGEFVNELKKNCNRLTFLAIQGMSQKELIENYKKAKVYIDFGPFPGAERMPKEAVLYGCTILTGKHGASAFYGDVPIPDEFKINEEVVCIDEINNKIDNMINNYDEIISEFDDYKSTVLNLENSFIQALKFIFLAEDGNK